MCVADSAEDVLPVIHRLLAELEEEPKPKYRVVEKL
jgi:hypothetical protein